MAVASGRRTSFLAMVPQASVVIGGHVGMLERQSERIVIASMARRLRRCLVMPRIHSAPAVASQQQGRRRSLHRLGWQRER